MAVRRCLGLLFLLLSCGQPAVLAEKQDPNQAAAAPSPIPPAPPRAEDAYPPNPFGFFRGHGPPELLEHPRAIGLYFDSSLMIILGLMFLFWVRTSYWVSRDSAILNLPSTLWSLGLLASGTAGFAAVFLLPRYYGLLPLFAFQGLPLYAYVRLRNSKVPEFSQVLTRRHLVVLGLRQLAWLGIRVDAPGFQSVSETRIRFLGKPDDRTAGVSEAISRQVENSPNYLAAKDLILRAVRRRASDIHLEPKEGELAVRFRVDGLMATDQAFDTARGRNLINIFKTLCGLDITERRRPQDGSFRAEVEDRAIDFRVTTQGTQMGEKLSIRLLDPEHSVSELDELGFRRGLYDQVQDVIKKPHGLILVAGPAGAGKSTTLHAALKETNSEERNVITIEEPIEYRLDSVTQIEIKTSAGQSFAEALKAVLRQDPDVVMVGEIRDGETAAAVCQAAHTGHLVFSTVHAQDSIAAVTRMLELGADPPLFSEILILVLAQRLIRRLCKKCRIEYKPTPKELAKIGLPEDGASQLYLPGRNKNCPACQGAGYAGLIGVFEVLPLTEEIRELIEHKPAPTSLRLAARNHGLLTLREEGLRLVARGITSVEELDRVLG